MIGGVRIRATAAGQISLMMLEGDMDASAAPELSQALADVLTREASPRIVLDLTGVSCVDSYGLGVVVEALKRARAVGGDVRLCGLQDDVRSILEMTGLMRQVRVYSDRDEAASQWT
jgi:anti-sigma B factor antagonist